MRHLAYFEALADVDERSTRWAELTAGLFCLKLAAAAARGEAPPARAELVQARHLVGALDADTPLARLLHQVIDAFRLAIEEPGPAGLAPLATRLSAYGLLLQSASDWAPAADVFEVVGELAALCGDGELRLHALQYRGFSLRRAARFAEATQAYEQLQREAERAGSTHYGLEASLSLGKVAIQRGNMPAAERMIREVIDRAEAANARGVVGKALHELSYVAAMREDYVAVLELSYRAFELAEEGIARHERLLHIARAFMLLGHARAARDAALLIASACEVQYTRSLATVLLMEIATVLREETVFERHRRALAVEPLTPDAEAAYLAASGSGLQAFGRRREAHAAFERMLAVAERHRLGEYVVRAEQLLRALEREDAAVADAVAAPVAAPGVLRVARAMSALRDAAGIPG